ncbi:histidine kinase [Echinococcus multilocularis]|uniref:Histidine kinase n=1 Tax=Echinococcus multilocularis TaxID=6211 RepID=A0A087VXA4_ECHMU|nr:histidine kinase [Echinococcus multilocularis]
MEMASIVSPNSASTSSTTVYLRRDHSATSNFRRPPTVRSLVLSEMFLPLENTSPLSSGRSRSACRSCLFLEPSTDDQMPPLPPTAPQNRKANVSSSLQRSDSFLSKLQSLFFIKRSGTSHVKPEKSPTAPKIQPPLINYASFASHFRGRSQSSASRNYTRFKKNASAQASPARSVEKEPLVYSTPPPKLTSTSTSLTSFTSSPAPPQRPKNLPLVQRRQRNLAVANPSAIQNKHFSAHLPGEVLHAPPPSQSSSGLWSASSMASLGLSLHRSSTVRPTAAGVAETNSLHGLRQRSPSVSSNDSAVELMPFALTKLEWIQHHPNASLVYASPTNRIYEEVAPTPTVVTPSLTEKTPTTAQPSRCLGDSAPARSASTTTLTSVETEAEPTYAVPLSTAAVSTGPPQPPVPPPVPPKGTLNTALLELGDHLVSSTPPALTASPQPPVFVEKNLHHRRAASALRVSYQRSPRFDDSVHSRRPASTVSPSGSTTTTMASSSSSSWYADILPYKPSTLPETLADRLRQRNSFILSTPAPPCDDLMTRSLFEPRQPSESSVRILPSRSTSRTRPVSFHDAPSTSINLPSLDHLLKPSEGRKALPQAPKVVPPLKGGLLLREPLPVQPSDSPLLGQYCRLKLVIPPSSFSTSSDSASGGGRTGACSTFM